MYFKTEYAKTSPDQHQKHCYADHLRYGGSLGIVDIIWRCVSECEWKGFRTYAL